ncbi:DUF4846 domain-containing protein [Aureisphaera galaxeae]|uniref:DUF4846 domain-containing protein n=1 Tax=Aureisphaera galaxeae TaxID=1538023 RepID=UPI00234FB6F8|nr:DUF4846 domain-containing protein [Aureisphaera galaxeae]MDC8006049.1 DUF4846 domain-containing protein [Aureisphaera galaxeae]
MKRLLLALFAIACIVYFFFTDKGQVMKNVAVSYVVTPDYLNEEGRTVVDRIIVPEGYTRDVYEEGSFQKYIQDYPLKEFGAEVINYDGEPYVYQGGHVGVFELSVPANGLQQCADALIRLRSEYLWEKGRKSEIGFNFTSGHHCSWQKYAEGYRPKINGNKVTFHKTAVANTSKENFYKYLDLVYTYAGTLSLYHELPKINSLDDIEVGDLLIYPGSPGHVILVADKAENEMGEKIFIFAQGNTPAQSVHILKNPNDTSLSPWYEITLGERLEIPTYYFENVQMVRFK